LAEAEALRDALVNHLGKIEEKCQALQRAADLLSAYEPCAKPEESDSQRDGKLAMLRVVIIMRAQASKAANAARTEEADAMSAVGQLRRQSAQPEGGSRWLTPINWQQKASAAGGYCAQRRTARHAAHHPARP
jgi:hypothetical protein